MSKSLTLRKLKNIEFSTIYQKFLLQIEPDNNRNEAMLAVAVLLINLEDSTLRRLGYRIIVEYCNQTRNYFPLYEIAINNGLYPISKFIEDHYVLDEDKTFFSAWNDSFMQMFEHGGIYQTSQQYALNQFFHQEEAQNISIVAPTSYGKSELIIEVVRQYQNKKICIVTSTKALLMQTKKRIKDSGACPGSKIIVHPEMYRPNMNSLVAVLTQERLQRLMKKDRQLSFDCIVIDEAHEMLENNSRSVILAGILIIAKKRNPEVSFKFLTPFVDDPNNLIPRYISYDLKSYLVSEYIKTEKYFLYDLKGTGAGYLYDQFMDGFYKIEDCPGEVYEEEIVSRKSAAKNIVYLNKPVSIEAFSMELARLLPEIRIPEIEAACKNISEYLNPQYKLIFCLKHGIIYHHGSVPDAIRIYVEHLYKNLPEIRFLVTSSTLLSGVNLPAERMFILDNKKGQGNLRPDAFKNLIGRVCRFSEIFHNNAGDLRMLEPEIHVICGKYFDKRSNCQTFLRKVARADKHIEDEVKNVLLKNTIIDDFNSRDLTDAREFVENYESGTVPDYEDRYAETEIGKSAVMNGIKEIDVYECEQEMQRNVEELKQGNVLISDSDQLMRNIQNIFIKHLPDKGYENLRRLNYDSTRAFYSMFFSWRIDNKSYAEMINLFRGYWGHVFRQNQSAKVFVGRWGDICMDGSHRPQYTALAGKTLQDIVNLAIVRIKEEQDFIDNILIRFVETLNDVGLLETRFYSLIKYGTDNEEIISLLKNGASLSLASLLLSDYSNYVHVDIYESTVSYDDGLISAMEMNAENQILIHEVANLI